MFTSATDNIVTARMSYSFSDVWNAWAVRLASTSTPCWCMCVCVFVTFRFLSIHQSHSLASLRSLCTLVLCFLNILLRHFSYLQRLCCLFCATQTYFVCDVSCTLSLYARLCKNSRRVFSSFLGTGAADDAATTIADDAEGDLKHIIRSVYLFQIERCECQSICTATPLLAAYVNGWRQTREAKCWIDWIVHRIYVCMRRTENQSWLNVFFIVFISLAFLYVCA